MVEEDALQARRETSNGHGKLHVVESSFTTLRGKLLSLLDVFSHASSLARSVGEQRATAGLKQCVC